MMEAKYERIKQDIIQEIKNGKFQPGEKVYSENEIKNKYEVSSITAVKALQELVRDGYIFRIQGKGSFVSKRKRDELVKFTDLEFSPETEQVRVLSVEKVKLEKKTDGIDPGEYIKVDRIKENGGTPYNYIQSFIASNLIKSQLTDDNFQSVYDRVLLDSGVDLLRQNYKQVVTVVFPAENEVSKALNIKNAPSVKQVMRNYSKESGQLLEYTISHKRWEYYSVSFESPNLK